jgi:hypothetical protein
MPPRTGHRERSRGARRRQGAVHQPLRALPDPVGGALHRRRHRARPRGAARVSCPRRGDGGRGQPADRRAGLAHDRADAAQDRSRRARRDREPLARDRDDDRRELARQAVLDGAPRLGVRRASLPAVAAGRPDRWLHRRSHSAGGGAVHGHGLRLVEPGRRRAAFHALAGGAQRYDHGGGLRADRGALAGPPSRSISSCR